MRGRVVGNEGREILWGEVEEELEGWWSLEGHCQGLLESFEPRSFML